MTADKLTPCKKTVKEIKEVWIIKQMNTHILRYFLPISLSKWFVQIVGMSQKRKCIYSFFFPKFQTYKVLVWSDPNIACFHLPNYNQSIKKDFRYLTYPYICSCTHLQLRKCMIILNTFHASICLRIEANNMITDGKSLMFLLPI